MTSPTTAPAGWYRDGAGGLRWFDGTAWTEHVSQAPWQAQQAPQAHQHWPGQPQWQPYGQPAQPDDGPSSAVHWMLPVGRSWQSVLAGYLGLLSLGLWVLGPFAIGFGVWALVRAQHGGHGRGRAITGIFGGVVGCVILLAFALGAGG